MDENAQQVVNESAKQEKSAPEEKKRLG